MGEMTSGWPITQRSRIRILSSLPAETRPEGFAPGGCHVAREHGSTCQLSALPHGAAARTTVCMFGSLKPSERSSELRSFGLSEADHSGILSVHVLCSNNSYASKQVKRSPFSARKRLRRRSAAFAAASHAEGHWFDPSRDHKPSVQLRGLIWRSIGPSQTARRPSIGPKWGQTSTRGRRSGRQGHRAPTPPRLSR